MPVIGFLAGGLASASEAPVAGFRQGLPQTSYVEDPPTCRCNRQSRSNSSLISRPQRRYRNAAVAAHAHKRGDRITGCLLHCIWQRLAQRGSEGKALNLRQLLGEQRNCIDGWSRLPSTRMTQSYQLGAKFAAMQHGFFSVIIGCVPQPERHP
jgi:hypothetical protein